MVNSPGWAERSCSLRGAHAVLGVSRFHASGRAPGCVRLQAGLSPLRATWWLGRAPRGRQRQRLPVCAELRNEPHGRRGGRGPHPRLRPVPELLLHRRRRVTTASKASRSCSLTQAGLASLATLSTVTKPRECVCGIGRRAASFRTGIWSFIASSSCMNAPAPPPAAGGLTPQSPPPLACLLLTRVIDPYI